MYFGEKIHRGKMSFSSYNIKNIYRQHDITVDVNFYHATKEIWLGFSNSKVTLLSFFPKHSSQGVGSNTPPPQRIWEVKTACHSYICPNLQNCKYITLYDKEELKFKWITHL